MVTVKEFPYPSYWAKSFIYLKGLVLAIMNNNWLWKPALRSPSHPWLGGDGYDYRSVVSKCLLQSLNLYFLPWKILLRWYGNQPFLILQSMCIHQRVYICVRNMTSFKDEVSGGNAGLSSVYKISLRYYARCDWLKPMIYCAGKLIENSVLL